MNEKAAEAEVLTKETFITSVKRLPDAGSSHLNTLSSDTIVIDKSPAMAVVRQKHAQLNNVVGSLSEKISAVLAQQERDFLAAYRTHMYNVQKELHAMREKLHRNETMENKSEKMKKIEEERDWYRKEALRLDAITTNVTKDLKAMKENLESMEEDRQWLETQLKACKKQNKVLRAELDVRVAVPGTSDGSESRGEFLPFDLQHRSGVKIPKNRGSRDSFIETGSGVHGLPQISLDATRSGEKLKKHIRSLKRELQHKSNELKLMKQKQHFVESNGGIGRSSLEALFLQCVESVKEEVGQRREDGPNFKLRNNRSAVSKACDLKCSVELDDFTSNDRVRLIERLLAHDEVLTFLYNYLFPSETSTTANTTDLRLNTTWSRQSSRRDSGKEKASLPTLQTSASLPDTLNLYLNIASVTPSKDGGVEWIDETTSESDGAAVECSTRKSLPLDRYTKEYLKSV